MSKGLEEKLSFFVRQPGNPYFQRTSASDTPDFVAEASHRLVILAAVASFDKGSFEAGQNHSLAGPLGLAADWSRATYSSTLPPPSQRAAKRFLPRLFPPRPERARMVSRGVFSYVAAKGMVRLPDRLAFNQNRISARLQRCLPHSRVGIAVSSARLGTWARSKMPSTRTIAGRHRGLISKITYSSLRSCSLTMAKPLLAKVSMATSGLSTLSATTGRPLLRANSGYVC